MRIMVQKYFRNRTRLANGQKFVENIFETHMESVSLVQ